MKLSGLQIIFAIILALVLFSDCKKSEPYEFPKYYTQVIQLHEGWNNFSSYIEFAPSSPEIFFSDCLPAIEYVIDEAGNYFFSSFFINKIDKLEQAKAYRIKTKFAVNFSITGKLIEPESFLIQIKKGYNFIPYLRMEPMAVDSVFALVINNINTVKNYKGDIFWPHYNVNNLHNMNPGEGYVVDAKQDFEFYYSAN